MPQILFKRRGGQNFAETAFGFCQNECYFYLQPQVTLQDLPDVALHSILKNLSVHDQCNMAESGACFAAILEEKPFWSTVRLDQDADFVNRVCRFVFVHSCHIDEFILDNAYSPDSSFLVSWLDVLMAAVPNATKVIVEHAMYLSSGLFVPQMPLVTELQLKSCPNLCVFSLVQGFECAQPQLLKTLVLTGVPGLDANSAVCIATSCPNLQSLDISRAWGPFLGFKSVHEILSHCTKLMWLDFCAHRPAMQGWVQLTREYRTVRFGPYISLTLGLDDDTE